MTLYVIATRSLPVRYYREMNGLRKIEEPVKDRATRLSELGASAILRSHENLRAIQVRG